MKLWITLLVLTCLTTLVVAAWFEYKPSKQKKVQQLNGGQADGGKSARYQISRTSTGPVVIASVDPEGKFILLENTSSGPNRRDINLDGWSVERTIDGKNKYTYTFRNYSLKAAKRLKIYGRGFAAQARIGDAIMYDHKSWGTGDKTTTVLLNDKGEEKASHISKTILG